MRPTVEERLQETVVEVYPDNQWRYNMLSLKQRYVAYVEYWGDVWVEWLKHHGLHDLEELLTENSPTINTPCLAAIACIFLGDDWLDPNPVMDKCISSRLMIKEIKIEGGQFVNLWFQAVDDDQWYDTIDPLYVGCIKEGDMTGSLYKYTNHYQTTK